MSELVSKLLDLHEALTAAGLAHAFGGAIALAYCVAEPRGTRDIDVNIFTPAANAPTALAALPASIEVTAADEEAAVREGQTRLWWAGTPIDVFLSNHRMHDHAATRIVWVPLLERRIPVLDGAALVFFKALSGRTRDWADIEAVAECSPLEIDHAATMLAELIGPDDPIYARVKALRRPAPGSAAG